MHYREISKLLGKFLFFFSFILFIPLAVSLFYEYIEKTIFPHSSLAFCETILITFILSTIFYLIGRKGQKAFYRKESILTVVIVWFLFAFIAALQFYLSGTLKNPIDAYFEAMSGLSTTGVSVISAKDYNKHGKEIPIYKKNLHFPEKSYKYL